MINPNDRFEAELNLLNTFLNYEYRFLQLYNFSCNPKDLFQHENLRKIFIDAKEHYNKEKDRPTYQTMFLKYLNDPETKKILIKLNGKDWSLNPNLEFVLIEDSIKSKSLNLIKEIQSEQLSGLELTEKISTELNKILIEFNSEYKTTEQSNFELMRNVLDTIDKTMRKEKSDYIPTGFTLIDTKTNGIPKSHLTIIAARPGMGKTDFMLALSRNIIAKGLKPGIISLEMTSEEIQIRNLSYYANIDSRLIDSGHITNEQRALIYQKAELLKKDNYVIDATTRQTPEKIKATLRKWILKNKIDIAFIDYMTLIQTNFNKQRFDLEIGQLSEDLREFAKETGLPIVVLSQLNRQVESRIDKKPMLSDLRESGSIEQDAKLVLFLHRPMYYGLNPFDTETQKKYFPEYRGKELYIKNDVLLPADDLLNVIIAKARAGQTGIVPLSYSPSVHKFENVIIKSTNDYSKVSNGNEDYPF